MCMCMCMAHACPCAPNLDQLFYIDDIFILNMNNFVYNKICITALSSSFLFQSKKCMIPKNGYLEGRTCNVNNSNQHWICTPNNQLMHVDTLKCLQQGKRYKNSDYWYLVLQENLREISILVPWSSRMQ